jgi:hypothetical protein
MLATMAIDVVPSNWSIEKYLPDLRSDSSAVNPGMAFISPLLSVNELRSENRSNALAEAGKRQLGPTIKPAWVIFRSAYSRCRTATLCRISTLACAFFSC